MSAGVARKSAFAVGASLAGSLLQLLTTALLARWLVPQELGAFALVAALATAASPVAMLGVAAALTRARRLDAADLSAALGLTLLSAGVVTGALAAGAAPLAGLFAMPAVAALLPAYALHLLFAAPFQVATGVLQRELRFERLAALQVLSLGVHAAVAVGAAAGGAGAWALVAGRLAAEAVVLPLGLAAAGLRVRPRLAPRRAAPWLRFGAPLAASQVLIAAGGHVDTAILAAALGSAALGAYSLAFTLGMAATARLASVVKTVAFAALARSDEEDRFAARALALLRRTAVVCTPVVVGLAVVGGDAVPLLLGPQWKAVPPLLLALAPAGVIGGLGAGMGAIVLARGHPRVEMGFAVMRIVGMSGAVALGVHRGGVLGAGLGVSAYHLAAFPLFFFVLARWGGLAPRAVARAIAPGLVASAAMGVAVASLGVALGGLAPALRLLLVVAAGCAVYPLLLYVLHPEAALDARDTAIAVFRRARDGGAGAQSDAASLPTRSAVG